VILAAGKGKRFLSKTPKHMARIAGVPNLVHTLNSASDLFKNIYIILDREDDYNYTEVIKMYNNVSLTVIDSGLGDADAIFAFLKRQHKFISNQFLFCWGDVYINRDIIIELLEYLEKVNKYICPLVIAACKEEDPYVGLETDECNFCINALWNRDNPDGKTMYHDQSIFAVPNKALFTYCLEVFYNKFWDKELKKYRR